jgi:hypothetical protein
LVAKTEDADTHDEATEGYQARWSSQQSEDEPADKRGNDTQGNAQNGLKPFPHPKNSQPPQLAASFVSERFHFPVVQSSTKAR